MRWESHCLSPLDIIYSLYVQEKRLNLRRFDSVCVDLNERFSTCQSLTVCWVCLDFHQFELESESVCLVPNSVQHVIVSLNHHCNLLRFRIPFSSRSLLSNSVCFFSRAHNMFRISIEANKSTKRCVSRASMESDATDIESLPGKVRWMIEIDDDAFLQSIKMAYITDPCL